MAEPYLGEIRMFGGNFAIKGWAMCNGQIMAIAQNTALFSLFGTTYGGNGTTTFALPDLRGRAPIHQGQGNGLPPYVIGELTGTPTVTLNIQQMPMHTHTYSPQANNGAGTGARPAGGYIANSGATLFAAATDGTAMGPQTIGQTGGSQPFSILQPVLCITFLVALNGIYPSRN